MRIPNTTPNTSPAPVQVVHPGPSKAIWDAALIRSGINPADVAEYNVSGHGTFGQQATDDTPAQ